MSDSIKLLTESLHDYLALRRGLGHQMTDTSRQLPSFEAFLQAQGLDTVTVSAALAWSRQPADPATEGDGGSGRRGPSQRHPPQ